MGNWREELFAWTLKLSFFVLFFISVSSMLFYGRIIASAWMFISIYLGLILFSMGMIKLIPERAVKKRRAKSKSVKRTKRNKKR